MALAIQKASAKKAGAQKPKQQDKQKDDIRVKVDRLAECRQKVASVDHFAKEAGEIEAELKLLADTLPGVTEDQPVTFAGSEMCYVMDPKKWQRTIKDMKAVAKAMGPQTFMDVAKVGLADIDKYLSTPEQADLIIKTRSGTRVGKLVPKG